ncbi:3-oxo-5-alpha-steroid 4-dehydrogenase-domain containing protein [Nitzschia inconspicua]|uniref:3-oxo-5-alpha-steroid 4-dehydrogenase-domain containing protein n=1 Tax=Nitzschia inconspicua TaxID=303405 RepID=A0A9K3Q4W4_9STRA|nr:3-oxo-5-alpha-steroid 4-dehydrogenase-domain containing protein [Nitzschia inconspicua]
MALFTNSSSNNEVETSNPERTATTTTTTTASTTTRTTTSFKTTLYGAIALILVEGNLCYETLASLDRLLLIIWTFTVLFSFTVFVWFDVNGNDVNLNDGTVTVNGSKKQQQQQQQLRELAMMGLVFHTYLGVLLVVSMINFNSTTLAVGWMAALLYSVVVLGQRPKWRRKRNQNTTTSTTTATTSTSSTTTTTTTTTTTATVFLVHRSKSRLAIFRGLAVANACLFAFLFRRNSHRNWYNRYENENEKQPYDPLLYTSFSFLFVSHVIWVNNETMRQQQQQQNASPLSITLQSLAIWSPIGKIASIILCSCLQRGRPNDFDFAVLSMVVCGLLDVTWILVAIVKYLDVHAVSTTLYLYAVLVYLIFYNFDYCLVERPVLLQDGRIITALGWDQSSETVFKLERHGQLDTWLRQSLLSTDTIAKIILCLSPIVALVLILGRPTTYGKLDGLASSASSSPTVHLQQQTPQQQQNATDKEQSLDTLQHTHSSADGVVDSSDDDAVGSGSSTHQQQSRRFHWLSPMLSSKWSWMIFESPCWVWTLFLLNHKRQMDYDAYQRDFIDMADQLNKKKGWMDIVIKTLLGVSRNENQTEFIPESILDSPFLDALYAMLGRDMVPDLPNQMLIGWFLLHYLYRSLVYPVFLSTSSRMPLGISLFAFCYTLLNGYLQPYDLIFQQVFPEEYQYSIQFWSGIVMGAVGFAIGCHSDHTLLELKREKESNSSGGGGGGAYYQIPRDGLFEYVSSPHYLGEILEWTGFCIACDFSLASVSFVIWTVANLVPRAYATHRWYHDKFQEEYPPLNRKVIIPFVV